MTVKSFVKLEPRRFIPDSELVSIGGNQYTTTFLDRKPSAAWQDRGGQDPTSISFTWDDSTGTTTITTSSAPNENIFLDYFLYFTTETVSYLQSDPVTPSGDLVRWDPRLTAHPSIPESASNMLNGVLSTSSTNVSIDNNDYAYNKYMTKYDNYKNKLATIYVYLNETYYNLAFGYITSVTSGTTIRVNIKSSTKLLEAAATLNNRDRYYKYQSAYISNLPAELEGKPIPVCYGPLSQLPGKGRVQQTYLQEVSPSYSTRYRLPVDAIARKAVYVGNYKYLLGICDNPWSRTSYETVPVTYHSSTTYLGKTVYLYTVSIDYIGYFVEGTEFPFYDAGNNKSGSTVYLIDYANNRVWVGGANDFTKVGLVPAQMYRYDPAYESTTTPGTTFNDILDPLSWQAHTLTLPANAVHQWTFEATDSGQYLIYFTYRVNDHADFDASNWDENDHFFILQSKNIGQSAFIQKYIESTGLAIDSASFSQAQSDADTDVLYTVNNENKIQSVQEVVENITTSCNGILYLDTETNKFKYKIVDSTLSGTDHIVSSNDILEPDVIPKISYEDTASVVRMDHPYAESENVTWINGNNSSRTSSFSRALNSEEKVKTLEHYLTRSSVVIDLKSETFNTPMVTYTFTLPSEYFFNIDIGDIIQVENVDGRLLQTGDSVRLLVISRTRSVEKIKLVGYEFTKIP